MLGLVTRRYNERRHVNLDTLAMPPTMMYDGSMAHEARQWSVKVNASAGERVARGSARGRAGACGRKENSKVG